MDIAKMRVEFTRWYTSKDSALTDAKAMAHHFGEYVTYGAHEIGKSMWIGWVIL